VKRREKLLLDVLKEVSDEQVERRGEVSCLKQGTQKVNASCGK
jgi:hypothetical protein